MEGAHNQQQRKQETPQCNGVSTPTNQIPTQVNQYPLGQMNVADYQVLPETIDLLAQRFERSTRLEEKGYFNPWGSGELQNNIQTPQSEFDSELSFLCEKMQLKEKDPFHSMSYIC